MKLIPLNLHIVANLFNKSLFLLSIYFVFSLNIFACSCSPLAYAPTCQLIGYADAVFIGEAIEFSGGIYRFKIEKSYKGISPETEEVKVYGLAGTSCEIKYKIGTKYLLFAGASSRSPNLFTTSLCSGSRSVSESDVNFLDSFLDGKTETIVFGEVLQWVTGNGLLEEDKSSPIEGASLILKNENHEYKTTSDKNGSFNFSGIENGDYELFAKKEPYNPQPLSYKISVIKGGCQLVFAELKAMSGIEGTLFYQNGNPASKQRVELLRKNRKGEWYSTSYMHTQTDNKGNFKFDDIESGEYILGYEIWGDYPSSDSPYPTFYFPGTGERSKAKTITLLPNQTISNLILKLPKEQTKRTIKIKITFPDGTPPGKNLLQISNHSRLIWGLNKISEGVYTFTGFKEREYEFSARYWIDDLRGEVEWSEKRIAKSEIIKLSPGEDTEVTLILNKNLLSKDDKD